MVHRLARLVTAYAMSRVELPADGQRAEGQEQKRGGLGNLRPVILIQGWRPAQHTSECVPSPVP